MTIVSCSMFYFVCVLYSFVLDYSPRIYMDVSESYYPSSIKYFSAYTHPTVISIQTWMVSDTKLSTPSSILPYFYGVKDSPTYAIILPGLNEQDPVSAIKNPLNHTLFVTYFTFYPYNRGKKVDGIVWDNHVGDIEHVHVEYSNGIPKNITASSHSFDNVKSWGDPSIEMVNGSNHFVLYSARGSHGLWFSNGTHKYHSNPNLYDYTSKGYAWDTWLDTVMITPYDWSSYPWLTSIFRWGDPHTDFPDDNCYLGYCQFSDGPVGMLGKEKIQQIIVSLKNRGFICDHGCIWNSGIF